ncbi:secondary thiamine-phosphate synthase enzyme YjbQ [Planctomycetota bacterium]
MQIIQEEFGVGTSQRNQMINIDHQVQEVVQVSGITNGEVVVFCPHTTGAITINENADPDVVHDLLLTWEELFPQHRAGYRHGEGNSDSHCKCSFVGASEQVLIQEGRLVLGTWQSLYFCEFDGPRRRRIVVQVRGV